MGLVFVQIKLEGELIIEDSELLLLLSSFKLIIAKVGAFPGVPGKINIFWSISWSLEGLTVEIEVRYYLLIGFPNIVFTIGADKGGEGQRRAMDFEI